MRNTFIPTSFLAVALTTERKPAKSDQEFFVMRDNDASSASRLYSLFFHGERKKTQPAFMNESVIEPDYFSSYE